MYSNTSTLQNMPTAEFFFATVIFLCALLYLNFFFNYVWNKKHLKLLDDKNNFNLIPYTLFGGLVCVFSLVPLFVPKNSGAFSASIALLLLSVVWAKYFYFHALRKMLKIKKFDKVYLYLVCIFSIITLYYLYASFSEGMGSLYDLSKPMNSSSVLRQVLYPYDLKNSIKIIFAPNFIFCFMAYIYLVIKSLQRKEYIITFGVVFTLFAILYTNSYALFNFKYWLPLNVMADVFELLRLNFVQKRQIKEKLTFNQNKIELLQSEIKEFENMSVDHKVFKHDLANKFMSTQFNLAKANRILSQEDSANEKVQDALAKAISAQKMATDLFKGKKDILSIKLADLINRIGDLLSVDVTFECKRDSDVQLTFDLKDLNNILVNLIKNSKEANMKNDHVWIKVQFSQDSEMYFFRVIDSGRYDSIPNKDQIFKRGISSKEDPDDIISDKHGLGLFSVKRLVENHHGTIKLIADGSNTCFEFCLKKPINI